MQKFKFKLIHMLKSGIVLILIKLNVIKDQMQLKFLCKLVSKLIIFLLKFRIQQLKVQKFTLEECHKH